MKKRQDLPTDDVGIIIDSSKRKAAKSQRQREQQAKPKKVTYEIDPNVADMIEQVAQSLRISKSGVASRFLLDALQRYAANELTFDGCLEDSRGPRFEWVVRLDVGGLPETILRKTTAQDDEAA